MKEAENLQEQKLKLNELHQKCQEKKNIEEIKDNLIGKLTKSKINFEKDIEFIQSQVEKVQEVD